MAYNTTSQYTTAVQISLVYLVIIGILGIISNIFVVIVFIKYEKLRTAANLFILNLALCDIVISLLDTALSIPSTYYQEWIFGQATCMSYGFLHYFFVSITVSTLAAISIDRFFHITKSTQSRAWRVTRTRALGMLLVIYIYVLLFTFPPLTGWSSFVIEEAFFSGCYINYSDQDPPSIGYSVIASTFLFLAPLIVMIICYHRIYSVVKRSSRKTRINTFGPAGTSGFRKRYPLLKRTHVQTAKMIIVVIFFCVIVWLPYVVVSLIKAFTGNSVVSPLASHITILITKSCVVYNVLIYVFLNRKLKTAIILFIFCGKTPSWFNKYTHNSISRSRLSKRLSDTDIPSDVIRARNRLSALSAIERENNSTSGNSSGIQTPVIQNKEAGMTNTGLSGSPQTSLVKNGTMIHDSLRAGGSDYSLKAVAFDDMVLTMDQPHSTVANTTRPLSQIDSDVSGHNILSFKALGDQNQVSINQEKTVDVTKVEARRRALRKSKQREAGNRKLPSLPSNSKDDDLAVNNNNEKSMNITVSSDVSLSREFDIRSGSNGRQVILSETLSKHSREDSSSTVFPSSNNSTMSEASLTRSVQDDSSIDASPRMLYAHASVRKAVSSKTSKTIGYREGRAHARGRHRHSKHSKKDPLQATPNELKEIQRYWKRMSLCLDDINADENVNTSNYGQ